MIIKKGSLITLSDNKKYLVLSKVNYNDLVYLYLSSVENEPVQKVCIEESTDDKIILSVVNDKKLIKELVPLFDKDVESLL